MTTKVAVLIDERDRRLGRLQVSEACFVIQYGEATFVRTARSIKLHHTDRSFAIVFEQTEPFVRNKLEAL